MQHFGNHKRKHQKIKNIKGKEIVQRSFDNIIDRIDANVESNCFITFKDHKENCLNHPTVMSHHSSQKWTWKNKQNNPR